MQRSYLLTLVSLMLFTQASLSLASGGYSGGGGYSSGGFNNNRQARPVDQTYEVGKAIFKGRQQGEPALEYCIVDNGDKVPLKRKTVKAYKNATYNDFANSLYQCDQPEKKIAQGLTRDSLLYVVYYLNKRHKLGLKGS